MTDMTQAPTPGPLSAGNLHTAIMEALAEDIQRQRPDAFREEDENGFEGDVIIPTGATPRSAFAKVNVSDLAEVILPLIAPTAPVEASGSERDQAASGKRLVANLASYCGGETLDCTDISPCCECLKQANVFERGTDPFGAYVAQLGDLPRPQPSGETREAVAWIKPMVAALEGYEADYGVPLDDMHELGRIDDSRSSPSFRIRVGHVRDLALLSARPLALGGQHSTATDFPPDDVLACVEGGQGDGEETEVQYEVWGAGPQGDFCAGSDTLSDAQNYAAVYGQDGPVVIKVATTTRVEWSEAALSTTPARAEAQDEGVAGEPWEVVRAPDDDPDWPEAERMDCAVWLVKCPDGNWRGVLGVDEDDARLTAKDTYPDRHWPVRTHPSPTPAVRAFLAKTDSRKGEG